MKRITYPHQSEIKRLFSYRPDGVLISRVQRGAIGVGVVVGTRSGTTGYWQVQVDGKIYSRARLIWIYHNGGENPKLTLDHINRKRSDDRIENLRILTRSQNNLNSRMHSTNSTGYRGVYNSRGRFAACIHKNNKKIHIGTYATPEEASKAYLAACVEFHGMMPEVAA